MAAGHATMSDLSPEYALKRMSGTTTPISLLPAARPERCCSTIAAPSSASPGR